MSGVIALIIVFQQEIQSRSSEPSATQASFKTWALRAVFGAGWVKTRSDAIPA